MPPSRTTSATDAAGKGKHQEAEASIADSKRVVEICTIYAQKGMINIFIVVFSDGAGAVLF